MKVYAFLLAVATTLLISCNDAKSGSESVDSTKVTSTEEKEEPKTAASLTSIEFLEKEFDFGTIDEGAKAVHVFKFKNTGENPLIISDARPGCGCTVPTFTKDPVAPGEIGEIKVEFDSKGKSGESTKRVAVISNTDPASNDISFKVNVRKKIEGPFTNQQ